MGSLLSILRDVCLLCHYHAFQLVVIISLPPPADDVLSPAVVSVSDSGPHQIRVSWGPLQPPRVQSYRVEYGAIPSGRVSTVALHGHHNSILLTGLQPDTQYLITVGALHASGRETAMSVRACTQQGMRLSLIFPWHLCVFVCVRACTVSLSSRYFSFPLIQLSFVCNVIFVLCMIEIWPLEIVFFLLSSPHFSITSALLIRPFTCSSSFLPMFVDGSLQQHFLPWPTFGWPPWIDAACGQSGGAMQRAWEDIGSAGREKTPAHPQSPPPPPRTCPPTLSRCSSHTSPPTAECACPQSTARAEERGYAARRRGTQAGGAEYESQVCFFSVHWCSYTSGLVHLMKGVVGE